MTSARAHIIRRALAQAVLVGMVTFALILGVEYIWAGELVDLRLYMLTSLSVSLLVFLILLVSQRHGNNRRTASRNPSGRGY